MKIIKATRVLLLAFVLIFALPALHAHAFAGGTGTSGDPYQVVTCADFESVASTAGSPYFIMQNNIDCTSDGNAIVGTNFFTGDFNGNGHKLTIAITTTGPSSSWAIWEYLAGGTIRNLWVDGTVTDTHGSDILSGLVYGMVSGTISNVKSTVSINGASGTGHVGALVAYMTGGTIENSYFNGTINTGGNVVGGLVGEMDGGTIQNSYSAGTITGVQNVGGLVGYMDGGSMITDSFSAASVHGTTPGGIAGFISSGAFSDTFWDITVSGQSTCDAAGISSYTGCTGVNSGNSDPDYFKNNSSNPPFSTVSTGWDFITTWLAVAGDYPHLRTISLGFTPPPTLVSPASSSTYSTTDSMSISFILPVLLQSQSLTLTFVPSSGSPVVLHLRDANPAQTSTFSLPLSGGINLVNEVLSTTSDSIPAGTYSVILSYQDVSGDPAATATATGVVIASPTPPTPVIVEFSSGGGGGGGGPVGSLISYNCHDPKASNYLSTGESNPQLCIYGTHPTTPTLASPIAPLTTSTITFSKNLKKGMDDPDVSLLQQFLDTHGFPVATTGWGSLNQLATSFGTKTFIALKLYQASVNLPATGYFGPMTREVVNKVLGGN